MLGSNLSAEAGNPKHGAVSAYVSTALHALVLNALNPGGFGGLAPHLN